MRKNSRTPNFHNLGVNLRLLVIVNGMVTLVSILLSNDFNNFIKALTTLSAFVQPVLILSMLFLYMLQPIIEKCSYFIANSFIIVLALTSTILALKIAQYFFIFDAPPSMPRALLLTFLVGMIVLYYFNLQQRAYSPAIAEARLQALQARIRPHFLFNSINAVLSLMRTQPKRAETALEDMADLFRVLMADNRDLVPLAKEIALCRQYLALEKLRLEERLQVIWLIDNMPLDALIPPLVLQPLLENAIYHGIEPLPVGGEIVVNIKSIAKKVFIQISNPCTSTIQSKNGNKMALTNIRERLLLHFDLEARLTSVNKNQLHEVLIVIPYHVK